MKTTRRVEYLKLPFVLFPIILVLHCTHDNNISEQGTFDIYLVRDSEICPIKIDEVPIEDIELPERPVATLNDIKTYEILQSRSGRSAVHALKFKYDMKEHFGYTNCCFVLLVDGERMYKGEYWANFMSTYPPTVIIHTYTDREFHIISLFEDGIDRINDPRIIQTLIDAGIEVTYIPTGTP
ncbi:MAG: hypothetical protein JSU61_13170 [Fidelibacterota bacterium]|nr:MAG: hypothetical protein JSU61_13170 [Candidatus Neomarinimicrobiota bacterium]